MKTLLPVVTKCLAWQCLPQGGGLLDQDPLYIHVMTAVAEEQSRQAELEAEKVKRRNAARR